MGRPNFIMKIESLLENGSNASWIHWSDDGTAIIIKDISSFTAIGLPRAFNHRNYSSFVRQLNM